jgi:arylsulfatase A-like enzyme
MFATWPGRVPVGDTSHVVCLYDFFATACELAGVENPPETDGISFVPLLEGRPQDQTPHEFLYWENGGHAPHAQAVRLGKWFAWRRHTDEAIELYDVEEDVASERDVAAEQPDVVQQVLEIIEREHVDSEWYLNPGESEEVFEAKKRRAEELGCIQNDTVGNTEYRGCEDGSPDAGSGQPDPAIPD